MLREEDNPVAPRAQLSHVLVVVLDVFGLGAGDEELLLYLYCLLLHTTNYNNWSIMRKALSAIDRIVLLCRNAEKTAAVYTEALGLKVHLQSGDMVELRDAGNMAIILQKTTNPAYLGKGYSPIISFRVDLLRQRCKTSNKSTLSCYVAT